MSSFPSAPFPFFIRPGVSLPPLRLRRHRRRPERRQVHPAQPPDRRQAVDRLAQGADHAVPRPGHPDARRQPGAAGGHARHLPAAPAPGPRDGGRRLDRRARRRPRAAAGGRQGRRHRGGPRDRRAAGRVGPALLAGAEQDRPGAAGSAAAADRRADQRSRRSRRPSWSAPRPATGWTPWRTRWRRRCRRGRISIPTTT